MRGFLDIKFNLILNTGILVILFFIIPLSAISNNNQLDSLLNLASKLKKNTDYNSGVSFKRLRKIIRLWLLPHPVFHLMPMPEN